jgi:hypothetical protein
MDRGGSPIEPAPQRSEISGSRSPCRNSSRLKNAIHLPSGGHEGRKSPPFSEVRASTRRVARSIVQSLAVPPPRVLTKTSCLPSGENRRIGIKVTLQKFQTGLTPANNKHQRLLAIGNVGGQNAALQTTSLGIRTRARNHQGGRPQNTKYIVGPFEQHCRTPCHQSAK